MKASFLQDSTGDWSIGRLIFIVGSLWNMFLCSWMVMKCGIKVEVVGVYTAIQGILSGYILIHKKLETDKETNETVPK